MTECEKCEFYSDEEACTAFECNGIECPDLPCEKYWIFTFGYGQEHAGKYVKVRGTYGQSREKMINKYGTKWAFQYSEEEWKDMEKDVNRSWSMETELEVIE